MFKIHQHRLIKIKIPLKCFIYDLSATVFYYALETQETKETTIIRA